MKNILRVVLSTMIVLFPLSLGAQTFWQSSGNNIYNTNTGNVGINSTNPAQSFVVGGAGGVNAGFEIAVGSGIVTQAYNRNTSTYASLSFDGSGIKFRPASPGGNLVSFTAPVAVTLNSAINGINLDLSTNYTPASQSVTGQLITLPSVTSAISSIYKGLSIAQNSLTSISGGASTWTGLDVKMPALSQTGGTLTATGLKITGGVVTSGTSYALTTDVNAGYVGIGTTTPKAMLDVNGSVNVNGNLKISGNIVSDGDICIGVCQ